MKNFLITVVFLQCINLLSAQKHAVNGEDYLKWKRISNQQITEGGELVSYAIDPLKGDSYLYIQQNSPNRLDSFERASEVSFPVNHKFAVFKITPGYDTLRNLKLKKVKKTKWPKDTLGIYNFSNNRLIKEPGMHSFAIAEKGSALAFIQELEIETKTGMFSSWFNSDKRKSEKKEKILIKWILLLQLKLLVLDLFF